MLIRVREPVTKSTKKSARPGTATLNIPASALGPFIHFG